MATIVKNFKCSVVRMAGRKNRESGENPERYRRCVRMRCPFVGESQSLRNWEGRTGYRNQSIPVRKSEELLEVVLCPLRRESSFCCRKSAAAAFWLPHFLFM